MKRFLFVIALSTAFASAQTSSDPIPSVTIRTVNFPQTLPELVALLPALAHDKQLTPSFIENSQWFGPYTEAADKALHSDPNSAFDAIPALAKNLQDPDPHVQSMSFIMLASFAAVPIDYPKLVAPLSAQIANAISTNNPSTNAALSVVAWLARKLPDIYVKPLEQLLLTKPCPANNAELAARILMQTVPGDLPAQKAVLSVLNDTSCDKMARWGVLVSANHNVGDLIIDNVVQTVNTSDDKDIRDAAIIAAKKIGYRALMRISDRLNQIVHDPSESSQSQKNAQDALKALSECQVTQ